MSCIIGSLLRTPFKLRTPDQKRDILKAGRPTPAVTKTVKLGGVCRRFNPKSYDRYKWLAGSEKLSQLYCWPCLLLSSRTRTWSTYDIRNLTRCISNHAISKDHIQCQVGLLRLEKSLTSKTPSLQHNGLSTDVFNTIVRKNRKLLEHLIDVTVLFAAQGLSFQTPTDNFKDVFLTFIKHDLDLMLCDAFDNVFTGSLSIQEELLACVELEASKWIKREMLTEAAAYSIQVDNTTDITERAQWSLIARFVDRRGDVTERFLGYHDVTSGAVLGISDVADTSACNVANVIDTVLSDVAYVDRLIGQSYDGATVAPDQLTALQDNIRSRASSAVLVHSPTHRLDKVLTQGARYIPATRLFFAAIHTYPSYLRHCNPVLKQILDKHVPSLSLVHWGSISKLLTFISDERRNLMLAYDDVLSSSESSSDNLVTASTLLAQLKDFHFVFLLTVYNDVLKLTSTLEDVLRVNTLDVDKCCRLVETTVKSLRVARSEDQSSLYVTETTLLTGPPMIDRKCGRVIQDDYQQVYHDLLQQILDNVLTQLEARFTALTWLKFITLVDNRKFRTYSKTDFPVKAWDCLKACFPTQFDFTRLKGELEFIYADDEFARKTPHEVVTVLASELHETLPQALKLYSIVLALVGCDSLAADSCLDRVTTHLTRGGGNSWLAVEAGLLRRLQKQESWYDDVITSFANTTKRKMDLFYK